MRHDGGDQIIAQVLNCVSGRGLEAVLVAVEFVIESGVLSTEHVLNVLALFNATPMPQSVESSLQLREVPVADTGLDSLRVSANATMGRSAMSRDISAELKELRLHGMSQAWDEVSGQEGGTHVGVQTCQWLTGHLLQAKHAHRAFVSVRHQMKAAKFPLHRDLAGFDFKGAKLETCMSPHP